jgi:Fungal fucose-specific lectin
MILEVTFKTTTTCLRYTVCVLGFLISLTALPALAQQQIHQLSYNGSTWTDQNLNGTGPQLPMSAFFTTPNDQFHVFYIPYTGQLSQLFYNGSNWSDIDLIPGDSDACYVCSMSGFSVANYQYVFFADTNGEDIHQMVYNNAEWVDTDITAASGTDVAGGGTGNIVALTTSPALHVYYTASDAHVHQLFATNGTNWQDQDLTTLTDGPGDNTISGMAALNIGNFQYVYYLAPNNHLHQLFYNNSSWTDEDLTVLTKTPPVDPYCTLSAFVVPGTKKMRVYFVSSSNDHIIQLASSNNGKWTSTDLTKKTKGAAPSGQVVAFPSAIGGTANVYYIAGGHVNRIYQPTTTTWANEDLTKLTNAGLADFNDQISGFSLQDNQYLYYVID